MKKQLERQVKRLQQSQLKPGVNTSTLVEAIRQTLTELQSMNRSRDPADFLAADIHDLLVETLGVDLSNLTSDKSSSQSQQHRQVQGKTQDRCPTLIESGDREESATTRRGGNPFSIENLLNGSHCGVTSSDHRRNSSSSFLHNRTRHQIQQQHLQHQQHHHRRHQNEQELTSIDDPLPSDSEEDDDEDRCSNSDLSYRASSPELDVTDDPSDDQKSSHRIS